MTTEKKATYDVVILGGRIAGGSLAIRLARAGLKTAVVDAGRLGSTTLSTHFLWPRGLSYLHRLGVMERLQDSTPLRSRINYSLDGIDIAGHVAKRHTDDRIKAVHGGSGGEVTESYACIRRQYLDRALIETAMEAGAEFFEATRLEAVKAEDGQVKEALCRSRYGRLSLKAPLFVAADGRASTLAGLIKAPVVDYRDVSTSSCWSYFSGLSPFDVKLSKRGTAGFGAAQTNDGLTMVLAWGAKHDAPLYLGAKDAQFSRLVAAADPEFAALLARHGKREERFYRAANLAAFKRVSTAGNVFLMGDAVCFKDQCTASGITHALRDAEIGAEAIVAYFAGRLSLAEAARQYGDRREADSADYFELATQAAEMEPAKSEELALMASCRQSPELASDFLSMCGDSLPVGSFTQLMQANAEPS